jgi:hypothetical protein
MWHKYRLTKAVTYSTTAVVRHPHRMQKLASHRSSLKMTYCPEFVRSDIISVSATYLYNSLNNGLIDEQRTYCYHRFQYSFFLPRSSTL